MSGYGYGFRGYQADNGLAPQTDTWSKADYASDHVCRPVIVDAEGRKHPIIYNYGYDTGLAITKTETVVRQQVHLPLVTEYKHGSHTKVEPLNHHGNVEDKWHKSSSPVHGHVEDSWHQSSSPVPDRPHKVEEFPTKVQPEVSPPKKFNLLRPSYLHQSPNSTGYPGHGPGHEHELGNRHDYGHGPGNTGYGDYNDKSGRVWHKPSENTTQKGDYDRYYRNNDSKTEPIMINSGGWARPSRSGWAAPPDTSLSRPTNDIGKATEFLKEPAKPSSFTASPRSRITVPITTGPRRDDYAEVIDSREASKRYGNLPSSFQSEETYTKTIDSREAARKYNGRTVPV